MYYKLPIFIPTKRNDNMIFSEHYECYCPFCGEKNLMWISEYNKRNPDGTNKCDHFINISKNGKFVFKSKPTVKIVDKFIYIDGVNTTYTSIKKLLSYLENIEYETGFYPKWLYNLMAISHSYALGSNLKNGKIQLIIQSLINYE